MSTLSRLGHREGCGCHSLFPADPSNGPRPFRLPGDPERHGRPRPYDVKHLLLDVTLDVARQAVRATATITVSQRDPLAKTLVLDAIAFKILRVTEGDKPLAYRYDGDHIHVTFDDGAVGKQRTISVSYTATPKRGIYFLLPNADRPSRPTQVWSQCQDEDARHWIPCHDYPNMRMSTEFIVTAPEGWHVLSNGELLSREKTQGSHDLDLSSSGATGPGMERWHWSQREPHVAYLMTLVAGRFSEIIADSKDLSIRYYVDPGREDDARRSFGRTPEMIENFEKLFGVKFPWVKYHQVCVHDFVFGGMENTSATTMTDRILVDARAALDNSADDIVAHELAHQWFGDLVTCRDWSHAWLNEGFATFLEHLDAEKKHGEDEYLYSLKEHADGYMSEDGGRYRRPIVCNTYANPIDLFDRHLYEKGGWVLHMLRRSLGDALFFGGVKRYLERHRGTIVETRDLLRALEEESGRSLEGFFDQWVFRAGHPELEVKASLDADSKLLTVCVKQKQNVDAVTGLFRLTLDVDVVFDDGKRETHTLEVSDAAAQQSFVIRAPKGIKRLAVDPRGAVLATFALELPRDWLLDALANDERAIVRWRAAAALSRRDEPEVVTALQSAVANDNFWGVGAEAAAALGAMHSERARKVLISSLDVKHPKVRRAVVAALGEFREDDVAHALVARLNDGDASVLVESELARSAGRTRKSAIVRAALESALTRESWRDVVRIGAIDGLSKLREPSAIALIQPYSQRSAPLGTRRSTVGALAELALYDRDQRRVVREGLESLIDDGDPYFTPELFRALARLGEPESAAAIERSVGRSIDGRVRRHGREVVRGLRSEGGGQEEIRRLRDELERVRDEQQSLRDELSKVLAKVDGSPANSPTKAVKAPVKKAAVKAAKAPAKKRKTSKR